ncbi:kinase-like domain-containing protein [Obelidium mucronatum]|nr:kinase-like domain-containing protein [Obelidium mucronatum]
MRKSGTTPSENLPPVRQPSAISRKGGGVGTAGVLSPTLNQTTTLGGNSGAKPSIRASRGSARTSIINMDPSILEKEVEILNLAAKKLDTPAGFMSSTNTLVATTATAALGQKGTVKGAKVNHGISNDQPKPKVGNRLELPLAVKRPTSAPNVNNIAEGAAVAPEVEEAQINANFMGNNLRSKKQIKQSAAAGNLKSCVHTFTLQDFTIREQIGKGAFARVHVVKFNRQDYETSINMTTKQFSKTYAIKSLRKADIVKTKQIKHVMSEKNILNMLKSPFIVELVTTFQDQKHLYLVLEYIPGGDMFSHIRKHIRFQEAVAKFYTCEIILALEYIHSKDVIYRDLKPENILIDPRGHIKIADFGFAKVIPRNHATTFCGTPAYMAPEIILKMGYTKAADWWSLGTVCYELMAGYSPFQAESPLKIYERILNYELRWSSQIGETGRDLLSKILESQPNKRLGMYGAKEIKSHPWFRGINWKEAEMLQIPVPFVPDIECDGDIRNFDIYTDQSSVITMQNGTMELTSEDNLYDGMFPDF